MAKTYKDIALNTVQVELVIEKDRAFVVETNRVTRSVVKINVSSLLTDLMAYMSDEQSTTPNPEVSEATNWDKYYAEKSKDPRFEETTRGAREQIEKELATMTPAESKEQWWQDYEVQHPDRSWTTVASLLTERVRLARIDEQKNHNLNNYVGKKFYKNPIKAATDRIAELQSPTKEAHE